MNAFLRGAAATVAIATFGIATSASAATTASADATAEILTALSVAVSPTDDTLDFGQLADGGITGNVNLVVNANDTRGTCPTAVVCSGAVKSPTFNVSGLASKLVGVSFVNSIETLNYVGTAPTGFVSTLNVGTFTTNKTGNQLTLDTSGNGAFSVGGTLTMQPNQAPGVYAGTVSVNVAYN